MKHISAQTIAAGLSHVVRRIPQELRMPVAAVVTSSLILGAVALPPMNGGAERNSAADTTSGIARAAKTAPPARKDAPNAPKPATATNGGSEVVGFYVNWDDTSYRSLQANIDKLTILMPEWYRVGPKGRVVATGAKRQAETMKLIRAKRPDLRVMPIVNNFGGGQDPKAVAKLLRNGKMRRTIAENIVGTMKRNGYAGVNIDFEGLTSADRASLVSFMRTLYPIAHRAGLEVSQDVLASSATYDYKALGGSADYLIPMMYDEHWKTSPAGPISSQGWYDRSLKKFLTQVPANKVVIALGTYSYDWSGGGRAKSMTYPKALAAARSSKQPVKLDPKSLNPTFWYRPGGLRHRVWMLDAVSAFNQVKSASKLKPRGYAIWRMGGEDPGLWKVLKNRDKLDSKVAASLAGPKRYIGYDKKRGLIVEERIAP